MKVLLFLLINESAVPVTRMNNENPLERIESSQHYIKTDGPELGEWFTEGATKEEPQFQCEIFLPEFNTEANTPLGIFIKEELSDDTSNPTTEYQHFQTEDKQQRNRSANALRNAIKRLKETEDEKRERLYKNATRAAAKRSIETAEEKFERRRKNAERVALKRKTEPEDKKELRRLKDRIRSANRRKQETPEQAEYRRYIDAVRSAFRRLNETEEQRQNRRQADIARAVRRKLNETNEKRERRLQCDRERSARRRTYSKLENSSEPWCYLEIHSNDSFNGNCTVLEDSGSLKNPFSLDNSSPKCKDNTSYAGNVENDVAKHLSNESEDIQAYTICK